MPKYGVALALSVVAAAAIAACSIGPKQDDPLQLPPEQTEQDGGLTADTDPRGAEDGTDPTGNVDAAPPDAAVAIDADAATDAKSEVCADGGVAIEAMGPWHTGKKCWKGIVFFECVDGIDGGAAMTCFARVSTGELFLTTTTHIPSGEDYRTCTDVERASVKMTPEFCAK